MDDMPSIVGPVQILNVEGGVVHFGDTAIISPKTASKSTSGSGTGSTGALVSVINGVSANATVDSNLIDQPTVGNN